MKRAAIVLAVAGALGLGALAAPAPAEARIRVSSGYCPGWVRPAHADWDWGWYHYDEANVLVCSQRFVPATGTADPWDRAYRTGGYWATVIDYYGPPVPYVHHHHRHW
jgi:hypothetical protein